MEQQNQTIEQLISEFLLHLEELKREQRTIIGYRGVWNKLKAYMMALKIPFYNEAVGKQYLESKFGKFNYNDLSTGKRNTVNKIEALNEFQETGGIIRSSRTLKKVYEGKIGDLMLEYMAYRKSTFGSAERTLISYSTYLYQFLLFLKTQNIDSLQTVIQSDIYAFIATFKKEQLATKAVAAGIIKGFFNYLYSTGYISHALALNFPKVNYQKTAHLPTTFTIEEISSLLMSIDRASPTGKRDYAILLLAVKLGMRSSDIRGLTFNNILWDKNIIIFTQRKTGKETTLPLLPEIGNAIIEYLKYGRPQSTENFCFLQTVSPHKPLSYGAVGEITNQNLVRAKINLRGRKHGPHALRHSFASRLLAEKTPLPIISEAMGHSRTQSTMTYLRIDLDSLRQCALEVPTLAFSFYPKRGQLL